MKCYYFQNLYWNYYILIVIIWNNLSVPTVISFLARLRSIFDWLKSKYRRLIQVTELLKAKLWIKFVVCNLIVFSYVKQQKIDILSTLTKYKELLNKLIKFGLN